MRDARTIEQTKDVVVLFANAYDAWEKANADGKRTFIELAGFIGLMPSVMEAIKDSSHIICELKDFDEAEMDELIEAVAPALNTHVSVAFHRKINKLLVFLHAGVDLQAEWLGINPPRPEIIQ